MRTTFALLVYLLLMGAVHAQNRPAVNRWSLEVMAGPSFPVGKFAEKAIFSGPLYNQTRPGIGAELALNYHVNRVFGVCLAVEGQENPVVNYGDLLSPPELVIYHVHPWQIVRLLSGVQFSQPLSARQGLILIVRAVAGAMKTSIPGHDRSAPGVPGANQNYFVSGTPLPWAFAYQADAGLKWNILRKVFLIFNAGYAGATAGYMVPGSSDPGFPLPAVRHTVPTGSLQLRIGAGFSL